MMKRRLLKLLAVAWVAVGVFAALGEAQSLNVSGTSTVNQEQIFGVGILAMARETGITAFAGGGQTGAYQLTAGISRVTTVASANDSVKLPACLGGKVIVVINAAAANSMNVYGQVGETINALSANAAFAVAANKMVVFSCAVDGAWYSLTTS